MKKSPGGLVIFDCDGTLVDSQHHIHTALKSAFKVVGEAPPDYSKSRSVIGLSLDRALQTLLPTHSRSDILKATEAFKISYQQSHQSANTSLEPLFDGIKELIEDLHIAGYQMAVATGNSQRGLERILDGHNIKDRFTSLQTADFHPSKPHPSMVYECLTSTMVDADRAMVVGDTSFDMQMARAAGVWSVGITWGYHDAQALNSAGAHHIVSTVEGLMAHIEQVLGS